MPLVTQPRLSASEAAKRVAMFLELDDPKKTAIALAEAAAQEIQRNPKFAALVRTMYGYLETTVPVKKTMFLDDELVPIKRIEGHEINPAAPLDPYFLNELYGPQQLERALSRYPVKKVQEAAAAVEQRQPGTKPKGLRAKAALIGYIVEHVAGPGY